MKERDIPNVGFFPGKTVYRASASSVAVVGLTTAEGGITTATIVAMHRDTFDIEDGDDACCEYYVDWYLTETAAWEAAKAVNIELKRVALSRITRCEEQLKHLKKIEAHRNSLRKKDKK